MESVIFNMDDVISRKDYLKNKEIQKNKRKKMIQKKKPPFFLVFFIVVLVLYVGLQFTTYKNKYMLINNVPTEIANLKDYDIYYTTSTYTYSPESVLNYTKAKNSDKEVVLSAKGVTNSIGTADYVYGIKENKLVRIKNSIKNNINSFGDLEVIIDKGVIAYTIYNDEVYALLKGKNIDSGIYIKDKKTNKYVKIISGEVSQIIVDENNIYIVNSGLDKNIYSYTKEGAFKKKVTQNRSVNYLIEYNNKIYFTDEKTGGKIYSVDIYSGKEIPISKTGSVNISNTKKYLNGSSYMGVYKDYIYYIDTSKTNKLFEAKLDGSFNEKEIIGSNIEKISIIGSSIIYKEKDGKAIYRYEIESKINSEVTSGRIIDFSTNIAAK